MNLRAKYENTLSIVKMNLSPFGHELALDYYQRELVS